MYEKNEGGEGEGEKSEGGGGQGEERERRERDEEERERQGTLYYTELSSIDIAILLIMVNNYMHIPFC